MSDDDKNELEAIAIFIVIGSCLVLFTVGIGVIAGISLGAL